MSSRDLLSGLSSPGSMRELRLIESPTEHACDEPLIERWNVFEPISARWSWLRVFGCCGQLMVEPASQDIEDDAEGIQRAA